MTILTIHRRNGALTSLDAAVSCALPYQFVMGETIRAARTSSGGYLPIDWEKKIVEPVIHIIDAATSEQFGVLRRTVQDAFDNRVPQLREHGACAGHDWHAVLGAMFCLIRYLNGKGRISSAWCETREFFARNSDLYTKSDSIVNLQVTRPHGTEIWPKTDCPFLALRIALWASYNHNDFRRRLSTAIGVGGNTVLSAAISGALHGAQFGNRRLRLTGRFTQERRSM